MSNLKSVEKDMVERLESMTMEQARTALASKEFGDIGSPTYTFCVSWVSAKEANLRDSNARSAAFWARQAAYAAYAAAVIAAISIIITIIFN